MLDNLRFYTDMGDHDHQYDSNNSNENGAATNNLFGTNSLLLSQNNNSFLPSQYERMDIQSRVGKDITNMLSNQNHNNLPIKKAISNNMNDGKLQLQQNNQKNIQYNRNHSRTTSSILFAAKNEAKEGKKIEELPQQQQIQYNQQIRSGTSSNIPIFNNNMKVNKSGNFAQAVNTYHQMNRIAEQFSCEKENNNNYASQFHQQQQPSLIQSSQYSNNYMTNNSNNLLANNFNNKSNSNLNIFASQAVSSSFNQPLCSIATNVPLQPIQNEEEQEEVLLGTAVQQSTAPHLAHLEYTREIVSHLRKTETNFSAKGGYMGVVQKEINERMRSILLDWLVDVHYKFKLRTETLFISINLIDRYLEKISLESSRLQLLGITSLFIAAKYEEVYSVPHINDLVYVCDNAYKKEEIFEMEGVILKVLDFNILSVSSFRFLDYFIQFDELGEKNYYLARYLIEIALLEYKMISNPPSLLASAAIYLVNKIRKRPVAWKEGMIEITGYLEQDIRPCAKQICLIVQTIEQRKYLASLRKKFQKPQYLEVAKIKIEQRRENVPAANPSQNGNGNNQSYNISQNNNHNLSTSTCAPFQQCASKDQEIIPETTNTSQLQYSTNFQQNQLQNGLQYNNNNFQQHSNMNNVNGGIPHNMSIPDQQLQQVDNIEISVPLQAAIILIEKKIATLKEKPSSIVQAILTNRLYSEGAQPIELKVPTQLVFYMIERKITNIANKQLWQLPVRLAKIITNTMLNPEKTEDLGFLPVEFVNYMIDSIVNDQIRISQNSQRQYFSNNTNVMNNNGNGSTIYQNFFNNN